MGLTRARYAKHRGVSRQAVAKAIAAGRITLLPDGTIDAARADAEWSDNTNAAMRRQAAAAEPRPRAPAAAARRDHAAANDEGGRAPPALAETSDNIQHAEDVVRDVLLRHGKTVKGQLKLNDVRLANELLRALAADLDVQKKRGDLVTKRVMERVVADAAYHVREGWMTWPSRVAPLLADELKIEQGPLQIALERQVREELRASAAALRNAGALPPEPTEAVSA